MNSIERVWKDFLKECITQGQKVTKDDGDEILEIIDNHCFIPNILEEAVGNQPFTLNLFLKLVENGKFNINDYPITDTALASYVASLDDPKQIYLDDEDSFIYTYPERLQNILQVTRDENIVYVNQLDTMVDRLREHSGSNRAVANLYMCALDREEQHIPCLQLVQALIRDDKLSLHIFFRSNDLYSAFPSNMLFIQYVGLKLVDELKSVYPYLRFSGVFYNSSSLHIYRGDFEQARSVVEDMI